MNECNYVGDKMYDLAKKIFPYCRSITGEGVRNTLNDLAEYVETASGITINMKSVKTGTKVFDWVVPEEWKIENAYIEDECGNHIIDMCKNNLHVMGYSDAVDKWVELEELKKYIFVQEDQPDVIPYVTSYYSKRVGFCMSKKQLDALEEGQYHMLIQSSFFEGELNYAECVIPGEKEDEVFFSTYICHPSMANNECSGPVLAAELINYVSNIKHRRYTYRFIFVPETIGSITYLATNHNLEHLQRHLVAGYNLTCVGDDNNYSMIETRRGMTLSDRVLENSLKFCASKYTKYSYLKRGSDERQYNSPGVNLPVACFCRSKFHEYAEYHTSADDLDYISPEGLQGSYNVITDVINTLENNYNYVVSVPCEPQLGKRGLMPTVSQKFNQRNIQNIKDLLAYADGEKDLLEISDIIGVSMSELIEIANKLVDCKLLIKV